MSSSQGRTSCAVCGGTFLPPVRIRGTNETVPEDPTLEEGLLLIDQDDEDYEEYESSGECINGDIIPSESLLWLLKARAFIYKRPGPVFESNKADYKDRSQKPRRYV